MQRTGTVSPGEPRAHRGSLALRSQRLADLQLQLLQAQFGPQRQPASGEPHAQEGPQLQGWHWHLSDIDALLGWSGSDTEEIRQAPRALLNETATSSATLSAPSQTCAGTFG